MGCNLTWVEMSLENIGQAGNRLTNVLIPFWTGNKLHWVMNLRYKWVELLQLSLSITRPFFRPIIEPEVITLLLVILPRNTFHDEVYVNSVTTIMVLSVFPLFRIYQNTHFL